MDCNLKMTPSLNKEYCQNGLNIAKSSNILNIVTDDIVRNFVAEYMFQYNKVARVREAGGTSGYFVSTSVNCSRTLHTFASYPI